MILPVALTAGSSKCFTLRALDLKNSFLNFLEHTYIKPSPTQLEMYYIIEVPVPETVTEQTQHRIYRLQYP